ncbi:MAG: arginine--tRNA ligase, partial [Gammaproteobacteria bacterium]|nr:arginine--tRNA ligase [Gammaproteobacteria bacterium]
MKEQIKDLLQQAISNLKQAGTLQTECEPDIQVERARDASHGDFASNLAMLLTKVARRKPRDIAEDIINALPESELIVKVEIAGPGFINFFLSPSAFHAIVPEILSNTENFGRSNIGAGKKVQVEFVSANPTGPLHVGHGRGAAYGATVADLLAAIGYEVHREYYVNDAGRQMDILAASVWLRYLSLAGETLSSGEDFPFPANGYKGDYVWDVAAKLHRENGDRFRHAWADVATDLPADEPEGGDK